ncbi:MAG: hypothetical protein KDD64_07755 [Bdellovibrionales bacterium]|nr:hypothetical protein [Bdellovibrionales bacterium]
MEKNNSNLNPFEIPGEGPHESEGDTFATWKEARTIVSLVGDAPRFISSTTHFLNIDAQNGDTECSLESMSCLLQLLKSPSFKSAIYYAAKTFHPKQIEGKELHNLRTLARIHKPSELSALIALLYLYRRIRKGCDKELFDRYAKEMHEEAEIAGLFGQAVEPIGLGFSQLSIILPFLGKMMMLGIDKKKFQKYRTYCKVAKLPHDIAWEESNFGCNHLQISLLLIQSLGFGKTLFDAFTLGYQSTSLEGIKPESLTYRLRLIRIWVSSLLSSLEPPDMTHRGEYYPMKSDLDHLIAAAKDIRQGPEKLLRWITRGKCDIGPLMTPELFRGDASEESEGSGPLAEKLEQELLEEFQSAGMNF